MVGERERGGKYELLALMLRAATWTFAMMLSAKKKKEMKRIFAC
jgi:hypothetical protein